MPASSMRVIHAVASKEGARFRCGRAVKTGYERLEVMSRFAFPLCKSRSAVGLRYKRCLQLLTELLWSFVASAMTFAHQW